MNPLLRTGCDSAAILCIAGTILGYLPYIAAGISAFYYSLLIWQWFRNKKKPSTS